MYKRAYMHARLCVCGGGGYVRECMYLCQCMNIEGGYNLTTARDLSIYRTWAKICFKDCRCLGGEEGDSMFCI